MLMLIQKASLAAALVLLAALAAAPSTEPALPAGGGDEVTDVFDPSDIAELNATGDCWQEEQTPFGTTNTCDGPVSGSCTLEVRTYTRGTFNYERDCGELLRYTDNGAVISVTIDTTEGDGPTITYAETKTETPCGFHTWALGPADECWFTVTEPMTGCDVHVCLTGAGDCSWWIQWKPEDTLLEWERVSLPCGSTATIWDCGNGCLDIEYNW